jgi:alkylation response protein AidB-like acyl-CoA dehydrogenase
VSLDLEFDDGQLAIGEALDQFCTDRCSEEVVKSGSGTFPRELWRELAELGMLAIATPEGDGGALEMCAAMEVLGRAVFPGPLVAHFLATQVLPEADRVVLAEGRQWVAVGEGPLVPWAPSADHFLWVEGQRIWRARLVGEIEAVETLGGEPWGRCCLEREEECAGASRALSLADIARAAYLGAAGNALVAAASEHAAARRQFGRAIGEFQAVAHPLADCHIRLGAATTLARNAACRFDEVHEERREEDQHIRPLAAAARLSAGSAALDAAYVCHQVFGAVGITLEGPAFHISRRIRQLVSQPPGDAFARETLLGHFGVSEQGVAS